MNLKMENELLIKFDEQCKQGRWRGLNHIIPGLRSLIEKHGKFCKSCHRVYLPGSIWRKHYPKMTHYPNERICGWCVYEEDVYFNQHFADDSKR